MASSEAARSVAASGGGRARVALLWSLAFLPLAWVWWRILSSDFGGGNRCVMTYMRPTYLPVPLPPREASPHAYGVYLYRENVDGRSRFTAAVEFEALGKPPRDGGPIATPAVFLPGNGGSYRQVRSLASETARLAHARRREASASASASLASRARDRPDGDPDRGSDPSPERARAVVDIDWFAVDFNEELSAFHAALLRRQTDHAREVVRRVLALYPPSTRVILVGHSMGGLVARGALVPLPPPVPGHPSRSAPVPAAVPAAIVLTLATPHAYSPAATQPSMARLLADLHRAWSTGVVSDVALVSVVGGVRDWQVSSSMANVEGLAPPDASLSVGVGDVPGARGVSADHQCIAWCNQLVRAAANALLDVAGMKEKTPAAARDVAASRFDARDEDSDSDSDSDPASRDAWGWTTRFAIRWTPSLIPLGMMWACASLARDATPPKRTARRRTDAAASVSVASLAPVAACAWNPALGVALAALARLRATFRDGDGDDAGISSESTSSSSASTAVVWLAALALAPSLAATAQTTIESRGARWLSHWSVARGALRGADGGADVGAVFTTVDLAHVARLVEDVVLAAMVAAPPPRGRRAAPGLSAERMTFAAATATAAAGAVPGWGYLAQHAAAMAAIAPWVGRGVAMVRGGGKGD